jgi:hypothetical protein
MAMGRTARSTTRIRKAARPMITSRSRSSIATNFRCRRIKAYPIFTSSVEEPPARSKNVMVFLLFRVLLISTFSGLPPLREIRQNENLIGHKKYGSCRDRPGTVALLHEFVHGDAYLKHSLATGSIMKAPGFYWKIRPVERRSVSFKTLILNA